MALTLLASPLRASSAIPRDTRWAACACVLAVGLAVAGTLSCFSTNTLDHRAEQERKAGQLRKEALDAIVASPTSRDTKQVSSDGGRTYVIHEGQLYSFAEGEVPRWERPPIDLLANVTKVVANGGTVLVLFDDGRARTALGGTISQAVVAENVTDIAAEGPFLFVNVHGQRLRYDAGVLLVDD